MKHEQNDDLIDLGAVTEETKGALEIIRPSKRSTNFARVPNFH